MTLDPTTDGPAELPPSWACSWTLAGRHAAEVRVAGELDLATAPQLAQALDAAVDAAPLTVVLMQDVTFMDGSGLHVLLGASERARHGDRRLVVARLHPDVQALLTLLEVGDELDVLPGTPLDAPAEDPLDVLASQLPPANPVNVAVVAARAMAVPDRRLWLQADDGSVGALLGRRDRPGRPADRALPR